MFNRTVIQDLDECWKKLQQQYSEIFERRFKDIYYNGDKKADASFFPSNYFPAGEVTITVWANSCAYATTGLWAIVTNPTGGHRSPFDAPSQHQIDAILQIPFIKRNPRALEFIKSYGSKFISPATVDDAARDYHARYGGNVK
jgi:hypothetical protein